MNSSTLSASTKTLLPSVIPSSSSLLPVHLPQTWTQSSLPQGSNEKDDQFGQVLIGGDFDGDGYDDLLVGSPYEDYLSTVDAGTVHAVYGSSSGLTDKDGQSFF